MRRLFNFLAYLPVLILSPILIFTAMGALALLDLIWAHRGQTQHCRRIRCPIVIRLRVVIPNWNGRDLLEKYLPSVVEAMSGHSEQRSHRC